jgi:hypothetical protein
MNFLLPLTIGGPDIVVRNGGAIVYKIQTPGTP